jgi:pimeloyl-ACP methyl ester carboxylesterase
VKRTVRANGVQLCAETFGNAGDPPILLIAGAAQSMDWWEDGFCERLAERRFVIRYDQRDTGRSVSYPPGEPGYGGQDLVADAAGILDAFDLPRAHVIGMSMGGGVAQRLALDRPSRVATLTLLSTSLTERDAGSRPLPPPVDELAAYFAQPPPEPDWTDHEAVVRYLVDDQRRYTGSVTMADADLRSLAETIVGRTVDVQSSVKNHFAADSGERSERRLSEIAAPTLVIHGTEDPLFPLPHGEALAEAIPKARLLRLEGVGHELPPRQTWDVVVPAILEHTAGR